MVECDFILDFLNFNHHFKTDFYHNTTIINFKRYLLHWIEYFNERGYIFSHINEMIITIVNDKMNMTYGVFTKQPMQALESRLNMIIAKNPHLTNSPKNILIIL